MKYRKVFKEGISKKKKHRIVREMKKVDRSIQRHAAKGEVVKEKAFRVGRKKKMTCIG